MGFFGGGIVTCGGSWSFPSTMWVSRTRTQIFRLGSKFPYPLSCHAALRRALLHRLTAPQKTAPGSKRSYGSWLGSESPGDVIPGQFPSQGTFPCCLLFPPLCADPCLPLALHQLLLHQKPSLITWQPYLGECPVVQGWNSHVFPEKPRVDVIMVGRVRRLEHTKPSTGMMCLSCVRKHPDCPAEA